jgi:hypothetical protein
MIRFQPIADNEPALSNAPILKAALLTFDYIETNGPIGLTPSKALKRYFVHWAAEAFAWPDYTAEELFAVNKVLNEADFPPLTVLHDVLLAAKLVRHFKGTIRMTPLAKQLKNKPATLWALLANTLLCVIDHSRYTRFGDLLIGNWDVFLNVINVEAENIITEDYLFSVLFGIQEKEIWSIHYRLASTFIIHVQRSLCWSGLLHEQRVGQGVSKQVLVSKTALWPLALALEKTREMQAPTKH